MLNVTQHPIQMTLLEDPKPSSEIVQFPMQIKSPRAEKGIAWDETPLAIKQRKIGMVSHQIVAIHDLWRLSEMTTRALARRGDELAPRTRANNQQTIRSCDTQITALKAQVNLLAADLMAQGFTVADVLEWGLIAIVQASVGIKLEEGQEEGQGE